MERLPIAPRPDWQQKAEESGFTFHTYADGTEPYWNEDGVYRFSLPEIETRIEDPATELHAMCREAVSRIASSQELMEKLAIPEAMRDYVADSWHRDEPELYGRFDLAYGGHGPAKMLEYNADTPTSLYEAASFQWAWLEDMMATRRLPAGADQFNRMYEALSERFAEILPAGTDIHFGTFTDTAEDYATTEIIAYAARDGGMIPHLVDIREIGLTETGQFADADSRVIGTLFKLYPWEDMLRDDFARHLPDAACRMIEPAWKSLLSNKGILPVLWEMFPGHPNLLPAFFEADLARAPSLAGDLLETGRVYKPIFSREGASITIEKDGKILEDARTDGYEAHARIVQAYHPLPKFDGMHPLIGAWIVGRDCVGMGIREDTLLITQDDAHFKPHFIAD